MVHLSVWSPQEGVQQPWGCLNEPVLLNLRKLMLIWCAKKGEVQRRIGRDGTTWMKGLNAPADSTQLPWTFHVNSVSDDTSHLVNWVNYKRQNRPIQIWPRFWDKGIFFMKKSPKKSSANKDKMINYMHKGFDGGSKVELKVGHGQLLLI